MGDERPAKRAREDDPEVLPNVLAELPAKPGIQWLAARIGESVCRMDSNCTAEYTALDDAGVRVRCTTPDEAFTVQLPPLVSAVHEARARHRQTARVVLRRARHAPGTPGIYFDFDVLPDAPRVHPPPGTAPTDAMFASLLWGGGDDGETRSTITKKGHRQLEWLPVPDVARLSALGPHRAFVDSRRIKMDVRTLGVTMTAV